MRALKCQVEEISFAAHADSLQTKNFIADVKVSTSSSREEFDDLLFSLQASKYYFSARGTDRDGTACE